MHFTISLNLKLDMDLKFNDYSLKNVGEINVLLGKNGSGKSRLLRGLDNYNFSDEHSLNTKYITPERGGSLKHDPNLERSISRDERWLPRQLRTNQYTQFKEQSVLQYRKLEKLVLREMESNLEKKMTIIRSQSLIGSVINLIQ